MRTALYVIAIVGLLTTRSVSGASKTNLAVNAGFEEAPNASSSLPPSWSFFTSANQTVSLSKELARSGTQSLQIAAQGVSGANLGVMLKMPVQPGMKYAFSAFVRNDREHPIDRSSCGDLSIEWLDANGKELGRVNSKPWDKDLSKLRWTQVVVSEKAPPYAASGNFVIHANDGTTKKSSGRFYVDDVAIEAD